MLVTLTEHLRRAIINGEACIVLHHIGPLHAAHQRAFQHVSEGRWTVLETSGTLIEIVVMVMRYDLA